MTKKARRGLGSTSDARAGMKRPEQTRKRGVWEMVLFFFFLLPPPLPAVRGGDRSAPKFRQQTRLEDRDCAGMGCGERESREKYETAIRTYRIADADELVNINDWGLLECEILGGHGSRDSGCRGSNRSGSGLGGLVLGWTRHGF